MFSFAIHDICCTLFFRLLCCIFPRHQCIIFDVLLYFSKSNCFEFSVVSSRANTKSYNHDFQKHMLQNIKENFRSGITISILAQSNDRNMQNKIKLLKWLLQRPDKVNGKSVKWVKKKNCAGWKLKILKRFYGIFLGRIIKILNCGITKTKTRISC